MNYKNKKWRFKILCVFALLCFFTAGSAMAIDYAGLIAVKSGVPLTPSPFPPGFDVSDNLRFFLDNSGPSPIAAGMNGTQINAEGSASDAVYNIIPFGTITVLADNGSNYGRTSQGKNINSGAVETMQFVGGAFKAYELVDITLTWKKEAPPSPPISAEHIGYTPDFRPIMKVSIGSYSHPEHELSNPNYDYKVFEGATQIDALPSDSGSWQPDTARFNPISADTTFKFEVAAHNWFGTSLPTAVDLPVPAPQGGGPLNIIYNFEKTAALGLNQFSIPIKIPVTYTKADTTTMSVGTIADLVTAINDKAVASVVQTIGWWNAATQVPEGYYNVGAGFGSHTAGLADDGSVALVRDRVYQISVSAAVSGFTLTGTRD